MCRHGKPDSNNQTAPSLYEPAFASMTLRTRQEYIDILRSHADVLKTTYGISYMRLNQLLLSSSGVQDLAGNCMTIMSIGEGFRKKHNKT